MAAKSTALLVGLDVVVTPGPVEAHGLIGCDLVAPCNLVAPEPAGPADVVELGMPASSRIGVTQFAGHDGHRRAPSM